MRNKTQNSRKANNLTGLTPIQEQTAIMLVGGVSVTDIANKFGVDRSTIYSWQKQQAFICFFNAQCEECKKRLSVGLYGLVSEALEAIRESLHSTNEQNRLKSAMWVVDKVEAYKIGDTDIREALKKECTYSKIDWSIFDDELNEDEYKRKLKAIGIIDD